MIVCARCGEHNAEDAEFCGRCGVFLKWQGNPEEQPRVLTPVGPGVEQPAVQQPTEQRAQRRTPPQLTERRPLQPGDLICGQCGTGNAPERKFCRHCGYSLAEARAVKRRWWQWLIPRRRTRKRHVGARPRNRGSRSGWRRVARWVGRLLVAALALGAVLYAAVPPFRSGVNLQVTAARDWVRGKFVTEYTPIRPTQVTATAELPDHGANLVADNAKNTFWAAPETGEPTLVLSFDRPVNIGRAIVRSGNAADFESANRPIKLHLVYSTGRTFDVNLADTPEPQTVDIGESAGATSVEVHIVAQHGALKRGSVAISEIELFEIVS